VAVNPIGEPGQPHPADSFTITVTSAWGDRWEWVAVPAERVDYIYRLLDPPNLFTLADSDQ
jgi:hypothetical protein